MTELTFRRVHHATPELLFDCMTTPEHLAQFWGPRGTSTPLDNITVDLRPGGAYRIEIIPTHIASGEYVEIDPPRRLVYTWGWEPRPDGDTSPVTPGSSTVEIELEPDGDGFRGRATFRGRVFGRFALTRKRDGGGS
jgi:uncharacterized protein YndB with AHSA1/START domain